MKKIGIFLAIVLFSGMILAVTDTSSFKIEVSQKDLNNELSGDGYGQIFGWNGNEIQIIALGLNENTQYQLVYYEEIIRLPPKNKQGSSYSNTPGTTIKNSSNQGSSYSSQRFPRITCILNATSSEYGSISKSNKLMYSKFLTDKKYQRLLFVPASDVNCKKKKFLRFNMADYLSGEPL